MRRARWAVLLVATAIAATTPVLADPVSQAICLARGPVATQDDWCESWVSTSNAFPRVLEADPSGTRIVSIGTTLDDAQAKLQTFDASTGDLLDQTAIAPTLPGIQSSSVIHGAVRPSDGAVIVLARVSGRIENETGFDTYNAGWLAAFASSGQVLWESPIGALHGDTFALPWSLAVHDEVIAVGSVTGDPATYGLTTAIFDGASGVPLWEETFSVPDQWVGGSVTIAPDGESVYTMTLVGEGITHVLAYDAMPNLPPDASRLRWRYEGNDLAFRYGRGLMEVSEDGSRIVLSGYDLREPRTEIAVLGLDRSGSAVWRTSVPTTSPQVGVVLDLAEPRAAIDVVEVPTQSIPWGLLDVEGAHAVVGGFELEWDARYGTTDATPAISAVAAAIDVEGGELRWVQSYRAATDRVYLPTMLRARGDRVLMTGPASDCNFMYKPGSRCSTEIGFVPTTVEFALSSGAVRRVARYNTTTLVPSALQPGPMVGPGYDQPIASALGPDGSYYVATLTSSDLCSDCGSQAVSLLAYTP